MISVETLRTRPEAGPTRAPALPRCNNQPGPAVSMAPAVWLTPAVAGVILGAGLFDLLPSAFAAVGNQTIAWAGAGLGLMMLVSAMASRTNGRLIGWAAGLGIWLHSILEGIAAGTGYGVSLSTGILISIGLVVHLVPESLALFGLLTNAGLPARRALIGSAIPWLLVVAGFFVAQAVMPAVAPAPLGRAMAFGAGVFIALAGLSWGQRSGSLTRNVCLAALGVAWVAIQHFG